MTEPIDSWAGEVLSTQPHQENETNSCSPTGSTSWSTDPDSTSDIEYDSSPETPPGPESSSTEEEILPFKLTDPTESYNPGPYNRHRDNFHNNLCLPAHSMLEDAQLILTEMQNFTKQSFISTNVDFNSLKISSFGSFGKKWVKEKNTTAYSRARLEADNNTTLKASKRSIVLSIIAYHEKSSRFMEALKE